MVKSKKFDLIDRLITFVLMVDNSFSKVPSGILVKHLNNQALRSATSSALNYSEAISAESQKDFIHKLKIVLKELRETMTNLKILRQKTGNLRPEDMIGLTIQECDELLAIFSKSIETAKGNISSKNNK